MINRVRQIHCKLIKQARRFECSVVTVFLRMIMLRVLDGIMLNDQITLGLLNPRQKRNYREVAGRRMTEPFLKEVNGYPHDIVADKALFHFYAKGAGIPVPETYLFFEYPRACAWTEEGRVIRNCEEWCQFFQGLPGAFLIKPATGMGGKGVDLFIKDSGSFRCQEEVLDGQKLYDRVFVKGAYGKCLVQGKLDNHEAIVGLSGGRAFQTIRLQTMKNPRGFPAILSASLKLVTTDVDTDNFDRGVRGGIWSVIDVELGRIAKAFQVDSETGAFTPIEKHPTTGLDIIGFEIPFWDKCVDLSFLAAVKFSSLAAIGWDIGITPKGPVFIEGNPIWGGSGNEGPWLTMEEFKYLENYIVRG